MGWKWCKPPGLLVRFTNSEKFKRLTTRVFEETDVDRDGQLSYSELYVAVLKLYDLLNRQLPCRLRIPTNQNMDEMLAKFDEDKSGKLSYPEFADLCRSLVGTKGCFWDSLFFKASAVIILKLVLFPLAAKGIKEVVKLGGVPQEYVDKVPERVLSLGMEMAVRNTTPSVPL